MTDTTNPGPLTESEFDELNTLLCSPALPDTTMNLEALDGLLCALAAGPSGVTPASCMVLIMGDEVEPEWESPEQEARFFDLLDRHWQDVSIRLNLSRKGLNPDSMYYPYIFDCASAPGEIPLAEPDEPPPRREGEWTGCDWGSGFATGVFSFAEDWLELFEQEDKTALLAPMITLNLGYDISAPEAEVDYDASVQASVVSAYAIRAFWRERGKGVLRNEPIRRAAAPERNDPCPCGSGKKYKRCCGAH